MMDQKKGEENVNTTKTGNSATTNQTSNTVEQKEEENFDYVCSRRKTNGRTSSR